MEIMMAEENQEETKAAGAEQDAPKEERASATDDVRAAKATDAGETLAHAVAPNVDSQPGNASGTEAGKRGRRAEKVGIVASDKMEKTIVVRVDRLIKHPKYRRYVRRTS